MNILSPTIVILLLTDVLPAAANGSETKLNIIYLMLDEWAISSPATRLLRLGPRSHLLPTIPDPEQRGNPPPRQTAKV